MMQQRRSLGGSGIFGLVLILALTFVWGVAASAGQDAANDSDSIYQAWTRASTLRAQQQYDESESVLRRILDEHRGDANVERRAWCEILFTVTLGKGVPEQQAVAREALRAFPDLTADTVYIPESVNVLLSAERRLMFGSLTIREPEGAEAFLDGVSLGTIPLFVPYLEVGTYELRVTRDGFEDYGEMFTVDPEGNHQFERIPLKRHKNTWYWVSRVGGGAVLASTIAYLSSQGGDSPTASDLPGAPAVPSSQ